VFVGEAEAGRAAGLITARTTGVMEAPVDGELAHGALTSAWLGLEPGGIHFAEEGRDVHGASGRGRGFFLFQEEAGAVELPTDPVQPGAEPGADPAGEGAGGER
jgi:hypothetical protein